MSAKTAEVVRAFRERLGIPGLVDVHTHFMPERVLDKVWDYFDAVGPLTGVEWPITYRHEEEQRVALLREFGVRAFTAMLYPHKPAMAAWLNSWSADFAARTPDCLHTATFFPEDGVREYVGQAVAAGARIFKAHLQVGGYDPTDDRLDPVWGSSPRPGSRRSCTAVRGPSRGSTPDPSRSPGCWPATPGCR